MAGVCECCPFNDGRTNEATMAQNYGCLPSAYEIVKMKRETGNNWACHERANCICAGLARENQEEKLGLDLKTGGLIHWKGAHNLEEVKQ